MSNDPPKRFEIKLPPDRRQALDRLAAASGLSLADLARLAINQLLEQRHVQLPNAA